MEEFRNLTDHLLPAAQAYSRSCGRISAIHCIGQHLLRHKVLIQQTLTFLLLGKGERDNPGVEMTALGASAFIYEKITEGGTEVNPHSPLGSHVGTAGWW